jgi:WD40 repeat protein
LTTPSHPEPSAVTFDAFISYRRIDGTRVAVHLRDRLRDFRLPPSLAVDQKPRKLVIFLDTIYERATSDFFEKEIKPALKGSRHLIVVRTSSTLQPQADGRPNWVEKEIAYFRTLPQGDNISIALAEGDFDDPLPGRLELDLPNITRVDMRRENRSRADLTEATLNFAAALFDIRQEQLPELRREDAKRKALRMRRLGLAIGLVILMLGGLLVWGLAAQRQKRLEESNARHNLSQFYWERASAVQDSAPGESLAYLAGALRQDGENLPAQALLVDQLLNRSWPLLVKEFRPPKGQTVGTISNDGKLICTTEDGIIRIWSMSNLRRFGSPIPAGPKALLVSGCNVAGDRLLTETNRRYQIWNVRSGRTTGEPIELGDSYNHAQSLDGRWVADCTDKDVTFLDVAHATRWVISNPSGPDTVNDVYFSPTGDKALVAGGPRVTLVDLARSSIIGTITTSFEAIDKAAVSPDGRHYALLDQFQLVVGTLKGKSEQALERLLETVEFTRDGTNIITNGRGAGVTIWRYGPLEPVMSAAEGQHASALLYSQESGLLTLDSTGSISLWRPTGGSPIQEFNFQVGNGTPIGKDLLATISRRNTVRIWQIADRKTGKVVKDIQLPSPWGGLNPIWAGDDGLGLFDEDYCGNSPFHETTQLLAVPNGDQIEVLDGATGLFKASHTLDPARGGLVETQTGATWAAAAQSGEVGWQLNIWDERGYPKERSIRFPESVSCFSLSSDSRKVAVRIGERLEVWDTTTNKRLGRPIQSGSQAERFFLEFDPAGEKLITLAADGAFVIWNVRTGRALDGPLTRGANIATIQWSRDGKRIATATRTGVLQIREIATGTEVFPPRKLPFAIHSLEFTPAGDAVLVISDRQIRMLSASTGVVLGESIPTSSYPSRVVINRDGWRLLLGVGFACRIWDLQTGLPLGGSISAGLSKPTVDFSPDGQRLWWIGRKRLYSWDTPVFSSKETEILADLAEAVSGYSVVGQRLKAISDQSARLDRLRRRTATAPWAEPTAASLIRWFLAAPHHRTRSPLTKP